MATQDYLYPKIPTKDSEGNISQSEQENFNRNMLELFRSKVSKDNQDTSSESSIIATAAEAIAGTNDTNIITPLKLRNGLNASGSAPVYACRAWVNFNGASLTKYGSGNMSSITDLGTTLYQINFTVPMPNSAYAVLALSSYFSNASYAGWLLIWEKSSTYIKISSTTATGTSPTTEPTYIDVAVFT